jgi:hypothetical protein
MSAGKLNAGSVRKALNEQVKNGEHVEKTPEFWKNNDEMMFAVVKTRGSIFLATEDGRKEVERKMEMAEPMFKEMIGWQTLKEIPQGKQLFDNFRNAVRMLVAQGIASSGHLNGGYGLKEQPQEPETPKGKAGEDGLLTPGSTPENAIDIDNAADDAARALKLRRGQLYEDKLRMVTDMVRKSPSNDMYKPHKLLAYRLLWTFKRSAIDAGIWNVFDHGIQVRPPHDVADIDFPTTLRPGCLVVSLFPYEAGQQNFIRDLDNGAACGWLNSQQIELFFKWGRPEPRDGSPYYLPITCCQLLDSSSYASLEDNYASLDGLAQEVRDHKQIGMAKLMVAFDPQAFRIPMSTKRVFFFCNPNGNHWIVVSGDIITTDCGLKCGLITVYNSIASQGLEQYELKLRKYFSVLSAIDTSPLHGINWMHARSTSVVQGISPQQRNGSDCGLIAVDNLLDLVRGNTPPRSSHLTPLEHREQYMQIAYNIVSESCGVQVEGPGDIPEDEDDTVSDRPEAVKRMIDAFTIEHWQYMIVKAQPRLVNDLGGQRRNIERLMHGRFRRDTVLAPAVQVCIPDGALPRAALVLNDHDVAFARPAPQRKPDLLAVFLRHSRTTTSDSSSTIQWAQKTFIDTFYPGSELEVIVIEVTFSSTHNFLGLTANGFGAIPGRQEVRLQPLVDRLDRLNNGTQRPLVAFLQIGIDGSTTAVGSLGIVPRRWENVDFSLHVLSRFKMGGRAPIDAACESDSTGRSTFAHYSLTELAARVATNNFSGLGPHLDSHNQLVYLLMRINQMKMAIANSGPEESKQWPLERKITGAYTRSKTSTFKSIGGASWYSEGDKAPCVHRAPLELTWVPRIRPARRAPLELTWVPRELNWIGEGGGDTAPTTGYAVDEYQHSRKTPCKHGPRSRICATRRCMHLCCWGYASPKHFKQLHGPDCDHTRYFTWLISMRRGPQILKFIEEEPWGFESDSDDDMEDMS